MRASAHHRLLLRAASVQPRRHQPPQTSAAPRPAAQPCLCFPEVLLSQWLLWHPIFQHAAHKTSRGSELGQVQHPTSLSSTANYWHYRWQRGKKIKSPLRHQSPLPHLCDFWERKKLGTNNSRLCLGFPFTLGTPRCKALLQISLCNQSERSFLKQMKKAHPAVYYPSSGGKSGLFVSLLACKTHPSIPDINVN